MIEGLTAYDIKLFLIVTAIALLLIALTAILWKIQRNLEKNTEGDKNDAENPSDENLAGFSFNGGDSLKKAGKRSKF